MILYYIGHAATQLAHVQAFVLLASFLASINSLPQAWLMCGQAVRIAQDLGLHVGAFVTPICTGTHDTARGHPSTCRSLQLTKKPAAKCGGACMASTGCLR
jgi:hypothetical protein